MKLYLDDVRELPDGYSPDEWEIIRTGEALVSRIGQVGIENIEIISFDHDLGEDCLSGYDVARSIEEEVYTCPVLKLPEFRIHSANPVGRKNLEDCFTSIRWRLQYNILTFTLP